MSYQTLVWTAKTLQIEIFNSLAILQIFYQHCILATVTAVTVQRMLQEKMFLLRFGILWLLAADLGVWIS